VVVWRFLLGLYVAAAVAALVIVNADQSNWPAATGILAAAALVLGWGTGSGWGAVAAWLLIPLALPFGQANQFTGGGETNAMVLLAVVSAAFSAVLILAAGGARVLYNRHRPMTRAIPESTERKGAPRLEAASPPPIADLRHLDDRNSTTERIRTP
jgi:amino acid transporter